MIITRCIAALLLKLATCISADTVICVVLNDF